jgi:hypothetical protein
MPPPPDLAARPWRDRTHQPGPIFPQSPGSIFGRPDGFLASSLKVPFDFSGLPYQVFIVEYLLFPLALLTFFCLPSRSLV